MKVKIIREECTGAGICEMVCPEVFRVEEDNIAVVLDEEPDESLGPRVDEAARKCPSLAIVVTK